MGNKRGLIEKICVARNERVGVYGFVLYRGTARSEVITLGEKRALRMLIANYSRWRMAALHCRRPAVHAGPGL